VRWWRWDWGCDSKPPPGNWQNSPKTQISSNHFQ
jgi:hypothetical protein